ncbi:MAG: hypothetical protein H6657_09185 [Ardenticatenaceae bacterium]|nr:hypothetical protein [Ardenticatenaceae bacterium]
MVVLAGALHIATLKAVLRDLEGWQGREIEATRQAFYHRLRMSQVDQDIHEPGQLLQALAQFVKQSGVAAGQLDDFLAGYAGDDWQAARGQRFP